MSYNKETGMYEGYVYKIINDVNDKIYIGQTTTTIKERWHGHMSSCLMETRYKSALYNAMRKYGREKFHIIEIDKVIKENKESLINSLNELEQIRIKEYKSLIKENGYNVESGGNNKKVTGRITHKYDIDLNYLDTYESCEEAGRQNNIDGCTIYGCCSHYYYTAGGFVWAFDGEEPIRPPYLDKPKEKKIKPKKKTKSNKMPEEQKRILRLKRLCSDDRKIYTYNAFGEITHIYNDFVDAVDNIPINPEELRKNLNGKNLKYKNIVIRYEDEPFNKYPRSPFLQPISIYDMQGNLVKNTETKIEAEKFVGASSGEITKAIKRGGSINGYMFSYYGEELKRKVYRWNKEVEMYDDNWNMIRSFASKKDVTRYFNLEDCHHQLDESIKNKKKYNGYYWKYKDEFEINS